MKKIIIATVPAEHVAKILEKKATALLRKSVVRDVKTDLLAGEKPEMHIYVIKQGKQLVLVDKKYKTVKHGENNLNNFVVASVKINKVIEIGADSDLTQISQDLNLETWEIEDELMKSKNYTGEIIYFEDVEIFDIPVRLDRYVRLEDGQAAGTLVQVPKNTQVVGLNEL